MNQDGNDIQILFLAGIFAVLLLVISFVLITFINQRRKWQLQKEMSHLKEQQQNQLIEAAVKSEETERHRIAETLHDEVGAILSSVRLHFSNINSEKLDEKSKTLHDKAKELLDDGIQKVRTISHNLHSTLLKEFGLNEAIKNFMSKIAQSNLIHGETNLDNAYHIQNPQTDLAIYRITQELINNILKHAHSNYINITSAVETDILKLIIQFDGNGLSQKEFEELRYQPAGLGLKNIQNRIILLKGSIYFEKKHSNNSITLTIPITAES